jgi:hypothetical protein
MPRHSKPFIEELREHVIHDLIATPKDRRYSSATHAMPEAKGDEFYAEAIQTIVADTLHYFGYHLLDSLGRAAGKLTYGRNGADGRTHYIQVRWRTTTDTFSPIRDITALEGPAFDTLYITTFMHSA